jgi:CRP-like cAMP-binding protein
VLKIPEQGPAAVVQNRVLACMEPAAFRQIGPHLQPVSLNRRDILQEHDRAVEHVYFLECGVASLLARTRRDGPVEVAMVGRLGVVGVAAVLGASRSPNRAVMAVPGQALRISASELRGVMVASPAVARPLLSYVHALLIQNSQTALCNARHELEERLCRWLLLAVDRLDASELPLTHDMLSMILGVRRAGITDALSGLERAGALRKRRGTIDIVDRRVLEQRTCECYRIITAEYRRLIEAGCHEHVIGPATRMAEC